MEYKSVFYPTEMDLYDALYSNGRRVSKNYLLELARDRGIFISDEEDREELARFISLINHDYFEFKNISNHIARSSRADKKSSTVIKHSIDEKNVDDVYKKLVESRDGKGEKYKQTKIDEKTTRIEIKYDSIDHSKAKMIQKVTHEAFIDIINEGGSVKIRHSANERIDQIQSDLVAKIDEVKGKKEKPKIISLEGINNTRLRTLFFTKLINGIKGYTIANVSKIRVHSSEVEMDEDDVEDIEDEFTGFITKAAFDGSSLLNSPEYQQLVKKGYYITSIRWVCIESGKNPCKIEMEVLFSNQEKCSGYKYSVRGIYRNKVDHFTQLRPVTPDEEGLLLSKLEAASNLAFDQILEESKKGKADES